MLFRSCRPLHQQATSPRKFVSLGGWCGPALILGKLGLRTEAYPFDFSRCTLDGVIHFIRNGFDDSFFPPGPPPYKPECVGIWVLFRGLHTAFAHFDLNDPKIIDGFQKKMRRFDDVLAGEMPETGSGGVTFFRTVSARDPLEELRLIPALEDAIRARNPKLDYRLVVTVHDQGLSPAAVPLKPLSDRAQLWALRYTAPDTKTLFDRSQEGYAEIVASAARDDLWPMNQTSWEALCTERVAASLAAGDGQYTSRGVRRCSEGESEGEVAWDTLDVDRFPWRHHDNIALIDGVASVGGTCRGVGSMRCRDGTCAYCGNRDLHKAGTPFRTNRPFTDEEDELLLVHLYKILTGGDKVEAVEQLAHEMNRGAFEVICRIQFLTQSSTKLTEGMDM